MAGVRRLNHRAGEGQEKQSTKKSLGIKAARVRAVRAETAAGCGSVMSYIILRN